MNIYHNKSFKTYNQVIVKASKEKKYRETKIGVMTKFLLKACK